MREEKSSGCGSFFSLLIFLLLLVLTYLDDTHQTINRVWIYDQSSHSYHLEWRLMKTRR